MNGSPPSRLREILRPGSLSGDTARIWTLQGAGLLFALVASVIVARTLGPADKGVVDLYLLLAALIGDLGGLGFGSGLLYYLANRRRPLAEVHGTGLVFAAAAGGVTALIGWAGLSVWERILPGLHPWALLLAFALGPAIYYGLIASNLLTGIDRAVLVHVLAAANGLINLAAVLTLYSLGILRSGTVILVTAGLSVLLATASFAVLRRRAGPSRPSRELFGLSLRYGFVLHVGIVANLLHFKVDQLMLNYWLGTAAVGIYAVGVRWAEMLFLLDAALGAAALYRITSSDARESFRLSRRLVKVQLAISGGAGIALLLLASPLVGLLYGPEYAPSVAPLRILIPGIVAWSVSKLMSMVLVYNRGAGHRVTTIAVVGMLLNVVLNVICIRLLGWGASGAAVASTITYLCVALLVLATYARMARRLPAEG